MNNPWGLTDREAEVVEHLCTAGCNKLVARKLGVTASTVSVLLNRASLRMRLSNRVLIALEWDRWKRSGSPMPADATAWRAS